MSILTLTDLDMKIIVEFDVDWPDYEDVSDELIYSDLVENNFVGMDGVEPKLIKIERMK